ncbi:MAG: hypothetical protein AAGJ81_12180 [Verrucomicrobiota bacterium]
MKIYYFLFAALSVTSHADILYGTFQFTYNNDFTSGLPSTARESTAFFVFDTQTQSLKLFNFVEHYISQDFFDHDFHEYEVSRYSGDDPIMTISELTDFSITRWRHFAETEIWPGTRYSVEVITNADGYFSHNETPLLGQAVSGVGEITSILLNQREEGAKESWSFERDEDRFWFRLDTKVGYKYSVYEGSELSDLNLRSLDQFVNKASDGKLIGSGDDWFYVDLAENDTYFMKAVSFPLGIDD